MADNLNLDTHISKRYNADLEKLREETLAMGGMVEQRLRDSLSSLVNGDVELAKSVIKNDHDINQKELEIDQHCAEVVALRQPTASDLRLILSITKLISDLESIGDLAQHLARMGKKLADKGYSMRYYAEVEHIGENAQNMLQKALNAFARLDAEESLKAMAMTKPINRESRALARQLATYMMEDPRNIKKTLRMHEAVRALERISAYCENICEYTIYLVKGKDVRYQSFDDIKEKILEESDED